jgi:hypothetical protein
LDHDVGIENCPSDVGLDEDGVEVEVDEPTGKMARKMLISIKNLESLEF